MLTRAAPPQTATPIGPGPATRSSRLRIAAGAVPLMLAGGALAAMPARAAAETLADAIALAYRTNPRVESSRYDVRVADEEIVQAKSEVRPTVTLSASANYNRLYPGTSVGPFNPSRSQLFTTRGGQTQLVVNQPLYTGGRASADRIAAEAGVGNARALLRSTEGDVLLAVITAYTDVRRYEEALRIWQGSAAEMEKLGREIVARREAGELTLTDVAQSQAQLSVFRQQAVLARLNLETARADYAALVGQTPGTLAEEPPLPPMPRSAEAAVDLALSSNPELVRARYAEQASRAGIAAAKSQGRPTLGLRGSGAISGEANPWELSRQDRGYTVNLLFSMPIAAGGRIASEVRQAEDRNGADRLRIDDELRTVARTVNTAWNGMVAARQATLLAQDQRRSAATQLDGMLNEYRVGLRSTFDVLYAQQSLRDAEITALQSRRDRYISEATLLRRIGVLEVGALMTGVGLHEPDAHLRAVRGKSALPWDGLVKAIDDAGRPDMTPPPLVRLSAGTGTPRIVDTRFPEIADETLAGGVPAPTPVKAKATTTSKKGTR